ncbi:MAG: alpha/beta hydrolase [Pseudomonadales bacterium]|nr:alpha/beta hydrolase [Pseudomonadales bacterium]
MKSVLKTLEGQVDIKEDLVFGTTGTRDLLCDVYIPPVVSPDMTSILLMHGGGWFQGDKAQLRSYAIQLARYGFVCVCSEYRLINEAIWPAQIYDAKAAVRWMRANAEMLSINPEKICVSGNSAGGHLALVLGGSANVTELEGEGGNLGFSSRVSAVSAIYAPGEIKISHNPTLIGALLGENAGEVVEHQASPTTYINADYPPTILVHGSSDQLVPHESSWRLYHLMEEYQVPAELHLYQGLPHAFDMEKDYYRQIADMITLYFTRHVVNKY